CSPYAPTRAGITQPLVDIAACWCRQTDPLPMRVTHLLILFLLVTLPFASVLAQDTPPDLTISAEAINSADLAHVPAEFVPPPPPEETGSDTATPPPQA